MHEALSETHIGGRADTAQPAIARWESGRTAVSLDNVRRLVRLCGFDLELTLVPQDNSDMAQAARLSVLSGQERMDRHATVARQLRALRRLDGIEMELNLPRTLDVLVRNKVAYILIGGLAAVYHGSPFPTEDADITPEMGRRNLDKLASALRELNARVRTDSKPSGLPFRCDGEALAAAQTWNLTTDAGDLDVTFQPSGTRGYPDLRRDAAQVQLYGVSVRTASLSDVIPSKQAANRPKDQRMLPALREILAERRGGDRDT